MILFYLINNPLNVFYASLIFSSALVLFFYLSFVKLRSQETQKIATIQTELEQERKICKALKTTPSEVSQIEEETQRKLLKIRVDILNIDFTIQEIFN
jgi:hypothetical protein